MKSISVGYKQTEVGVIPTDWKLDFLGQKASIFRGGSPRPIESYITTSSEGVNWIKIGDVSANAKYIKSTSEKIIASGVKHSREVKAGDLLLSNSMSYGRPYILCIDGCIHDGWLTISNYEQEFEKEFLCYILGSECVSKQYSELAAGTGVKNLNKQIVGKVQVPYPVSINEQRAIATALSDMDALIEAKTALLEKKRAIKQGAMQELLTGRRRLPGFAVTPMKQTDIGEFPKDWKLVSFESDASFKARIGWQGLTTSEYLKYGYAYLITGTDFDKGKINWEDCHYVTRERYLQDSNIQVEKNDILITKDGTIGKVAYIPELDTPATLNSGVFVVRPKNNSFQPHFMYHILGSSVFRAFLDKLTAGSTIVHLYQKDLGSFVCYIPQLAEEQEAIAGILSSMDDEIDLLEQELKKLRDLKQGMMQELLTGRIRLVK